MKDEVIIQEFIEYWNKNNKDKYFDELDVRHMLKKFYFEKFEIIPDFRNKTYSNIWKNIQREIFKK